MKLATNIPAADAFLRKEVMASTIRILFMSFISILFNELEERKQALQAPQPHFFIDLNLDQIVDAITGGWNQYDLNPYFHYPLHDANSIIYRQDVFRDLENLELVESLNSFAELMRKVRANISLKEKLYYQYHKETWYLYAAEIYCSAVKQLENDLSTEKINSQALISLHQYLKNYIASEGFINLDTEANSIKTGLSKIKYQVLIKDNSLTVQSIKNLPDYSKEIERTFKKFQQDAAGNYLSDFKFDPQEMNHIEAKILEFVTNLNPELFSRLLNFCTSHFNFMDETVVQFDREIHFYISYLEYISILKRKGLNFCYPQINNTSKEISNIEGFDLALAQKLANQNKQVVCNDFHLEGKERIIVVTGPNQGGKTTFSRTFGQLHFLAELGCPVPGKKTKLFLADKIFTQFERSEKVENLRGKLEDDLTRVYKILNNSTSKSIIIMNEIFNSTTLQDMTFLSGKVLERITELDALCVWVTFVEELASFNDKVVSMTSMIYPDNPTLRTFKIIRRPADGLAYAMAIVKKYKLTYKNIEERIGE